VGLKIAAVSFSDGVGKFDPINPIGRSLDGFLHHRAPFAIAANEEPAVARP